MSTHKVAFLAGDGIGPEVADSARRVVEASGMDIEWVDAPMGLGAFEATGDALPASTVETVKACGTALKGPTTTPIGGGHVSANVRLRKELELFANVRPVKTVPGLETPYGAVDMVIVRENTEGEYSSIGGRMFPDTDREIVVQESVMSRFGVDRILRYAFDLAGRRGGHLTSATKSNGISITMPYWDERVEAMAAEYPEIKVDKYHIDILTAQFVLNPDWFDVVVASNLFGDILSDLGPACTGTIGIAPSGNINPEGKYPSLFEPVHGSAPDIVGTGQANPTAAILSGALMLDFLGETNAADRVRAACDACLDMQGTTSEIGDAIAGKL